MPVSQQSLRCKYTNNVSFKKHLFLKAFDIGLQFLVNSLTLFCH